MTSYLFLAGAIIAEVIATSLLGSTDGFSRPIPTAIVLTGYGTAFFLLAQAIARDMQVGVAYALWSGVGTILIVGIGIVFLKEPLTAAKLAGVALVVAGVVLLNLTGAH